MFVNFNQILIDMRTKSFFSTLLSLIFSLSVNAQINPDIEWQKSLGGTDNDEAVSVHQTSDGGYIVAGSTESIT